MSGQAVIRAAHFSPTTPGVDVYLTPFTGAATRTAWLSNVSYGAVSPYETLPPGLYTVAMRLAGSNPSTPPALTWVLDARAGAAYTIAGVGSGSAVRGVVIPDELAAPPSGQGLVRVIQAASRAPVATVAVTGGPVIAPAARFATVTSYAPVSAGTLQVTARSATDPSLSAAASVQLESGQISSILLLDGQGSGITMRTLLDSAAAATVPVGAVPAGAGGTATAPRGSAGPSQSALLRLAVLAALSLLTLLVVARSAARSPALNGRRRDRVHGRHAGR
jgi:hypothetical protein